MELKESDYILGYWFASDHEDNCWYKMIIKRGDKWLGQYTFRYNKEEKGEKDPFSGKDEKSIYQLSIDGDVKEDEVINIVNKLWNIIKVKYNGMSDMFLVQGDISKFLEIAKTKEYLHLKTENKG